MVTNSYNTHSIQNISRRHISFILLFSSVLIQQLNSQDISSNAPPLKERIFFGGSFGLQLGTITDIEASPIVGFWVLPRIAVAAGPNYRYYKDLVNRTSIYGGRLYTQIVVIRDIGKLIPLGSSLGIFLHAENELLSLESAYWKLPPFSSDRFYVNTVLCGFGLSQQLGRKASLNFMALWALNESLYDIYSNPELRVSFTF